MINNVYDYYSGNKIKDKKETQLLNKELKEFTDKFGKNMGFQVYNPFYKAKRLNGLN